MSFRILPIKSEYSTIEEDVVTSFLVPVLKESVLYKRAAGFFSSSALAQQTYGICSLVRNGGKIRLIASPMMTDEDIEAIRDGIKQRDTVVKDILLRSLSDPVGEEIDRLNLLTNLLAAGVMELKIAFVNTGGLFHDKFGIAYDFDDEKIAFRGSMNETEAAFIDNFESIDVYKSWEENHRVEIKEESFDRLWNDIVPGLTVKTFPEINTELMKRYRRDSVMDLDLDLRKFSRSIVPELFIHRPQNLTLHGYQKDAIYSWKEHDFVGVFDMATGTGKTVTALGGIELFEEVYGDNIAVWIICPYIHLVNQWEEDVRDWGAEPVICHSEADPEWANSLARKYRRFRRSDTPFVCIMTNDSFLSNAVQEIIQDIRPEMKVILIVDEAHNFGAGKISTIMPHNISYRLALSATIERYRDEKGTKRIFEYFGEKCIEYPLERAINEGALVKYMYHPILVALTEVELEEYKRLTSEIGKYIKKKPDGKIEISKQGERLLFERSRLVAAAEEKVISFEELIRDFRDKKHILVYCGATNNSIDSEYHDERQIDRIEKYLGIELNMTTHRFTAEENLETRRKLKEGFSEGHYQVITAIKCLDEGMNIPNIQYAFILASSRNPKEFIQRRGRVLRLSEGKHLAEIYDFITLPRQLENVHSYHFEQDQSLIKGELARLYEFGRYSINMSTTDRMIDEILDAYDLEIDIESLLQEVNNGEENNRWL